MLKDKFGYNKKKMIMRKILAAIVILTIMKSK